MHRLLVSAAHKSSGKTLVTLGLAAALGAEGCVVQPFKKGPDYIDPMWLALAAGRPCFNLDPQLSSAETIRARFARSTQGADLALVEGNKGLHDGVALDGSTSSAALAKLLGLPVLLVIDARGMTRGVAPLLLGNQTFDRGVHIAGVVLNRVGGARHEAKLRAAIEHYTDLPVLGAVAEDARLALTERHLGLVTSAETADAARRVAEIGRIVAAQVDLVRVRAMAAAAPAWFGAAIGTEPVATAATVGSAATCATARVTASRTEPQERLTAQALVPGDERVRIAIARDRAFGFYYPDDLEALAAAGAELVFFDTLHDWRLPDVDGLFVGGGFPETCLGELEANVALRAELREAIEGGLPTYAECGGLMVLARSVTWQGRRAEMVGAIPGDAVMHARPIGRGYVRLEETAAMPWPALAAQAATASATSRTATSGTSAASAASVASVASVATTAGTEVLAHEFHHSSLENLPAGMTYAYRVKRGHGIDGRHDGLVVHKLLASYAHLRGGAGSNWPERFVAFVRQERHRRLAPANAAARSEPPARRARAPRHTQPATP